MSVAKPLLGVVALIVFVLGASLGGVLLTRKKRGVAIKRPEPAPAG